MVSDKRDAEAKAEADKKQAVADEKKRQAEEERLAEEKEAKRQENKTHRKKRNNEAKECLRTVMGWSEEEAEKLLVVIIKGQISNVSINY